MAEGPGNDHNAPTDSIRINQQLLRSYQAAILGVNTVRPKFPQYGVAAKRKDSFRKWPPDAPDIVDGMVDAGLVYTGTGDSVRCFYCGGGMKSWAHGDDPWVEHAKWYPKCPHVLLVKGQGFVDRLSNNENTNSQTDAQTKAKEAHNTENRTTNTDLLKTVAARSCLECGYSEIQVSEAIKIYMRMNDDSVEFRAADIAEIILDRDIQDKSANNQSDGLIYSRSDLQQDEDQGDVETLLEENRRLRDSQMCKICIDDIANVIFLPCGHMVSCPRCASAVTNCPVCRVKIEGTVKAFFE